MARNEPNNSVVLSVVASALVSDRNCIVSGVALAAAAASCTVLLYDPPANTTTSVGATLRLAVSAPVGDTPVFHCDGGIQFLNGCIAVVAGTGALATVAFSKI